MSRIVVQKYGGSSVADVDRIRRVAERIVRTKEKGYHVVAVVSAMGATTDELLALARTASKAPKKREMDMLLSVGERISMSLLSMAIQDMGYEAISFTGSQCGIITSDSHSNARIIDVKPVRISDELEKDNIVIIAGFQGMSYKREITTLGRGGSDTTAVALAAALGAEWCEMCSDVDGVYSADPRRIKGAEKIEALSYDEMEEMGVAGAEVLNPDAIEFAASRGLKVFLSSTFKEGAGTLLLKPEEDEKREMVKAIASSSLLYQIHLIYQENDNLSDFLKFLDDKEITSNSLQIQHQDTGTLDMIVDPDRVPDWREIKKKLYLSHGERISFNESLGSVSIIGAGIAREPSNLSRAVAAMSEARIDWRRIEVSRNRISFYVDKEKVDNGAETLHNTFFPIKGGAK